MFTLRRRLNLRKRLNSLLGRVDINTFFMVFIEPCFNHCNLRCPYCPVGQGLKLKDTPQGMMPFELFQQIIDKSFGTYQGQIGLYNWGEAFLNPDLAKMVRCLKEHTRARLVLNSNFSLKLDERLVDVLASLKNDTIVISCDGYSQEVCEKYRVGVDFELVMHNVEWINSHKKPETQLLWQYLRFPWNGHEQEQAEQYCKTRHISFHAGEGGIAPHYPILPTPRSSKPDRIRCEFFRRSLSINYDGRVYPCCAYFGPPAFSLGNAAETSIQDIFSRGKGKDMLKYLTFRSAGDDDIFCKHCVERNTALLESWK
jgi:radical SAM protein with 4Fe4S-binding SPASM domain